MSEWDRIIQRSQDFEKRIKQLEDKYESLLFDTLRYVQSYGVIDKNTDQFEGYLQKELKALEEKLVNSKIK